MALAYEFDWTVLARPEYRQLLVYGLGTTLLVAATSTLASLITGSLLAAARLSPHALTSTLATAWVSVARHVPGVFWVLFCYFALPELLPERVGAYLHGLPAYAVIAGVLALTIDNSTYVSDIVRTGVLGIPRGEREAAICCGLTRWQQWICCLLPLTVRAVTPPLANRVIHNVKNSSLCMVIGVQDLTWASQQIGSITFRTLESLAMATAVYILIGTGLGALARHVERRTQRGRVGAAGRARPLAPHAEPVS